MEQETRHETDRRGDGELDDVDRDGYRANASSDVHPHAGGDPDDHCQRCRADTEKNALHIRYVPQPQERARLRAGFGTTFFSVTHPQYCGAGHTSARAEDLGRPGETREDIALSPLFEAKGWTEHE